MFPPVQPHETYWKVRLLSRHIFIISAPDDPLPPILQKKFKPQWRFDIADADGVFLEGKSAEKTAPSLVVCGLVARLLSETMWGPAIDEFYDDLRKWVDEIYDAYQTRLAAAEITQ